MPEKLLDPNEVAGLADENVTTGKDDVRYVNRRVTIVGHIRHYLETPEPEWRDPTTPAMEIARDMVTDALRAGDACVKRQERHRLTDRVDGKPTQAISGPQGEAIPVSIIEIIRPPEPGS